MFLKSQKRDQSYGQTLGGCLALRLCLQPLKGEGYLGKKGFTLILHSACGVQTQTISIYREKLSLTLLTGQ